MCKQITLDSLVPLRPLMPLKACVTAVWELLWPAGCLYRRVHTFFRCLYKYCSLVVTSVFNFPVQNKTCYLFHCGMKDASEKKDQVLSLILKCSPFASKHLFSQEWQQVKLWPCFPKGVTKPPLASKYLQFHTEYQKKGDEGFIFRSPWCNFSVMNHGNYIPPWLVNRVQPWKYFS